MKLSNVEQVLFVDDDYKTIAEVTSSFLEQGIQVQYWNGSGNLPESVLNARIVVLDLDLTDSDMKAAMGDEFYIPVVNALKKIPGPFIVIIVAREFDKKDPNNLRRMYKREMGAPFCGYIADRGLTKEELTPRRLESLISSLLAKNVVLNLVLAWERMFDKAKDVALDEIAANNVDRSIRALVKILYRNFGESEGAARALVDEMTRLVSRRTCETKHFRILAGLVDEINNTLLKKVKIPTREDLLLYSRLIFYTPTKEEAIMTGDIFKTTEEFKYGIILTPKCDLMQRKTKKVLICYGFPLKRLYFRNKNYPPHKNDPVIAKLHEEKLPMINIAENVKKRYLENARGLPNALQVMWHFNPKEGTQGICLDFNNVQSVEISRVNKWRRLARIDSPYIDEILQRYGSLASRIGSLEINRSPSQLQDFLKETEEECKKRNRKQ